MNRLRHVCHTEDRKVLVSIDRLDLCKVRIGACITSGALCGRGLVVASYFILFSSNPGSLSVRQNIHIAALQPTDRTDDDLSIYLPGTSIYLSDCLFVEHLQ